jgi:hypothetical protein
MCQTECLDVLYAKDDQMKEAEISRAGSTHGVIKKTCEVVVGKPEGKKEQETYI